jgi:hypothetical protein
VDPPGRTPALTDWTEIGHMRPYSLGSQGGRVDSALERAHARSGDAAMTAGYLGKRDTFDRAIAPFSRRYADHAERDHPTFMDAIRKGRIEAQMEHENDCRRGSHPYPFDALPTLTIIWAG